jgi:hypothetical protein
MKLPTKQRARDYTIKVPTKLFHLARLLEDGINPLTEVVLGGTLDFSMESPPGASSQMPYAAVIFRGVLSSDQIVKMPNLTKWWWVRNETLGAFTLKMQTPLGMPSTAIPRNSHWHLVHCDGNNNIVVSPPQNLPKEIGAREWIGPERQRDLAKILDLACVPSDRRTRTEIAVDVDQVVERALFVQRIRNLKRQKDTRMRLKHIAKLSRDLLKALEGLDDEVFKACRVDRVSVIGLLATLLDVPLRYFAVSQPKKLISHRPRGSIQNPVLRMLILELYASIVEGAQGKITLRKDVDDIKGTLPDILEVLRPYLPDAIPVKLPYETLRDIRKSALRARQRVNVRVRD